MPRVNLVLRRMLWFVLILTSVVYFCRLKAYCNYFWRQKINLSGISPSKRSQSGPNSVYVDMSKGEKFREFWVRSAYFWQNGGWDKSRRVRVFLCGNPDSRRPFGNFAMAHCLHICSRNVIRCRVAESGKIFSKIFTLAVICPQNLKSKIGQTGTSLRAGHGMHCREILFTPRCSPRARKFPRSDQLFSTTYGCGATGR